MNIQLKRTLIEILSIILCFLSGFYFKEYLILAILIFTVGAFLFYISKELEGIKDDYDNN